MAGGSGDGSGGVQIKTVVLYTLSTPMYNYV